MKRTRVFAAVTASLAAVSLLAACSSQSVSSEAGASGSASSASTDFSSIIPEGDIVAASQKIVDTSLAGKEGFTPPTGGPQAQKSGATIAFVGGDLTNGGINGVAAGVQEAAAVMGWTVNSFDGKGTAQGRKDAMQQAIVSQPAAIIVGGFDSTEQAPAIKQANDAKIPVIGWHASATPGPGGGLFTNISTDPLVVSQLAAAYAVASSKGTAGVAIFTDSQYDVAVLKANAMKAYIEACSSCSVLDYQDSPISETSQRMPGLVSNLLSKNGDKLTYLMAINGSYFSGAQQALRSAGTDPAGAPYSVAAGDGDAAEFQRIRTQDYQAATVAEPLNLQGWQLVDEINRALAGEQDSGFLAQPALITSQNVPAGTVFDPASGYRDIYKTNWGK